MPFFSQIESLPPDPILSIPPLFAADKRQDKVNLGVGAYRDESGKPQVLSSVKKAEKIVLDKNYNKEYLPIDGDKFYLEQSLKLVLGPDSSHIPRAYTAQTVGGSGGLKIVGQFLRSAYPKSKLYLSNPTWDNHHLIFSRCGYELDDYDYYHKHSLNFDKLKASLNKLEPKSIVVLHACCHNPTGCDPTADEWKELSGIMKDKELFPLFDLAYQGFGDDLEKDAFAIRYFADQGHEMAFVTSHAKNFGLYGERVGFLTILVENPDKAAKVGSHIKKTIRSIYSSPPLHGVRIVSTILESEVLRDEWKEELAAMRNRIIEMRNALAEDLFSEKNTPNFEFIKNQKGLFTLLGLNPEQVQLLIKEHGLYMTPSGRINIAGLNSGNVKTVAKAILSIL